MSKVELTDKQLAAYTTFSGADCLIKIDGTVFGTCLSVHPEETRFGVQVKMTHLLFDNHISRTTHDWLLEMFTSGRSVTVDLIMANEDGVTFAQRYSNLKLVKREGPIVDVDTLVCTGALTFEGSPGCVSTPEYDEVFPQPVPAPEPEEFTVEQKLYRLERMVESLDEHVRNLYKRTN